MMADLGVSSHLALGMLRHEGSFKLQGSLGYLHVSIRNGQAYRAVLHDREATICSVTCQKR